MTDSSLNSPAWLLPPANYLAQRDRPHPGAPRRLSLYVPVRDGTRLALDIYLPTPAPDDHRFPVLFTFTPYCRRFALAPNAPQLTEAATSSAQYRDFFPHYGYALVVVDTRGTGASFGSRTGMRAPEERLDYHDIIDWVSKQPWCNGRVCITGISYVGAAADFAASTAHPAIRAIMPVCSVWDTWGDMFYPGGLLFIGMLGGYGRLIDALDQDDREVLKNYAYWSSPGLAGPAPVDEDADGELLAQAIAGRAANFDMTDFITQLGLRGAALRHDPNFTTHTMAPKTYLAGIPSTLPHYGVSGWMDGAGYTAGAVSRFHALLNPEKRLLLGPWDHGCRSHVSPLTETPASRFELLAETLRFFDQHVAERETGLEREHPVHYYTMIEETWHAADSFPPAGTKMRTWSLGPNASLSNDPPPAGADEYRVNHGIGTGKKTRYERIAGQPVENYYSDWHGRDAHMLHWTTAPFDASTEITGTPIADLWLTADTQDAAIILYLEDVAPDGLTRYITEGALRASCRATAPAPPDHPHPGPYHPCTQEAQRHLVPGEPARLEIAFHPTSWLLLPRHRLRLALAGADRDHLARVPFGVSPLLTILRGAPHPSALHLPITPRPT